MGTLVVVKTSGEITEVPAQKLALSDVYKAIDCELVERIKVRYEGKVRDAFLDEEGWCKPNLPNPTIKRMAEAYYGRPCQEFAGDAAIWIPTPRSKKS